MRSTQSTQAMLEKLLQSVEEMRRDLLGPEIAMREETLQKITELDTKVQHLLNVAPEMLQALGDERVRMRVKKQAQQREKQIREISKGRKTA